MVLAATMLVVTGAGFLLFSATAKAANPATATAALVGLGVEHGWARVAVATASGAEAIAAIGIVIRPDSSVAQALCLTLFAAFALTGLLALATGRTLECGCMGALHRSKLGWPQVGQFVVAALALAFVDRHAPGWSATTGAAVVLGLALATAAAFMALAVPVWRRIRRARTSLAAAAAYRDPRRWGTVHDAARTAAR